jgi:hypothetical protein
MEGKGRELQPKQIVMIAAPAIARWIATADVVFSNTPNLAGGLNGHEDDGIAPQMPPGNGRPSNCVFPFRSQCRISQTSF